MNYNMVETAKKMMAAFQELIKNSETIQQKKVDEHLQSLQVVVKQSLPLKSPNIENFYFSLIHTLTTHNKRNHLDETQLEIILDIFLSMFVQNEIYDFTFINKDPNFINLTALLIQFCLQQSKVSSSKSIIKKSLVLIGEIWQKFNKKKDVYPQICSTLFKVVNNEFSNQVKVSKSKYIALNLLDLTMSDLFKDMRKQKKVTASKNNTSEMKNFVVDFLKKGNKSEKGKDKKMEVVNFEEIALNKIKEFIKVLNSHIEKATQFGSNKLIKQIARFCIKCVELNAFDVTTITDLIHIFFFVDADYDQKNQNPSNLNNGNANTDDVNKNMPTQKLDDNKNIPLRFKVVAQKKEQYEQEQLNPKMVAALIGKYDASEISSIMEILKQSMLMEIKRLPRLVTELMEEKYLKTLRNLYRIFELSKEVKADCFLHSEKELICDSIEKSLKFRFNLKIKLMDNPQSVVPLKELDLIHPVNEQELQDLNITYYKIKSYLIVQSMPIANYKEEVLKEVNRILYSLNKEVSLYLFEHFYSNLVSIDYEKYLLEGSVSSTLLATLCQQHYILQQLLVRNFQKKSVILGDGKQDKEKKFKLITQVFLGGSFHEEEKKEDQDILGGSQTNFQQYFDHLMVLDFYENFEIKSEDIETLQLLAIENAYYCYKLINNNYQNTLRLLTFLLKKHTIENYSIRVLTELLISTLAFEQKEDLNANEQNLMRKSLCIKDFIQQYSSSIVQRCLIQIRQIDMLQDKEGPFRTMDQLFIKFQGFHYLSNEVENVIATLNRCYDRFYLRSDHTFIRLYLDFFSSFIKFWNENTQIKQMTIDELRKQKEEYKQFSDDSNPQNEMYKEKQANEKEMGEEQENQDDEKGSNLFSNENNNDDKKIRMGNIVRHLLIRIKGLVTSRQKIHSVQTLQILSSSLKILYKQRQERENDNINFSTNDPENVSIPDSLGPILHEFEGSFTFILKNCALEESSYLASGLQVLNIYIRILDFTEAKYAFMMVNNIRKHLSPLFLNILKVYSSDLKNSLRSKLAKSIVQFYNDYMSKKPDEKLLRSESCPEDDKIIDDLKNFKQCLIKFLKENKENEQTSKVYITTIQNMYNMLDEIV